MASAAGKNSSHRHDFANREPVTGVTKPAETRDAASGLGSSIINTLNPRSRHCQIIAQPAKPPPMTIASNVLK
jgi:hypothetical protein